MDTIVVGADGHANVEIEEGTGVAPPRNGIVEAPSPKVVICGKVFICSTAGTNSFHTNVGISFHYDFAPWLSGVRANDPRSVRSLAIAIATKAHKTFLPVNSIKKSDTFWTDATKTNLFVTYSVYGFSSEGPQFCDVRVTVNQQQRSLEFPPPKCDIVKTRIGHQTYSPLNGSIHTNADLAWLDHKSSQHASFVTFARSALAGTKRLLTDETKETQEMAATVCGLIRVEGELNSEFVGGSPVIGILVKGKPPRMVKMAEGR
jgi:hypothetical protein